ncbi:MAG: energy transducer TonB [Firmicutes bacterium]|nr:energy transducer TonB [Bacillota bacterium]
MATYNRLGNYLLANELASDPVGKVHRGLMLTNGRLERHLLVRTFSDELVEAGIAGQLEQIRRAAEEVSTLRGFAQDYRTEGGRTPHVACNYIPGRSLAQMLAKTRQEQIPFGVDHALSVLQGLAQSIVQLHDKGLSHGLLGTHSVWVSFEGATHILDAPYASAMLALLPKCPHLNAAMGHALTFRKASPLQRDLQALGAILYEMLTLEKLPSAEFQMAALDKATLKAAQDESPIPTEILGLLRGMLGLDKVFESPNLFLAELERVLYDGDYSPTTFNMAFFMHTLFREENEQDGQLMKADRMADLSSFVEKEAVREPVFEATHYPAPANTKTKYVYMAVAGAVLAGVLGLTGFFVSKMRKQAAQLALAQKEKDEISAKLAELNNQEQQLQAKQSEAEKTMKDAKATAEEKRLAKAQLEETKRKQEEMSRQKAEIQQRAEVASQKTQTIAQTAPVAKAPDAAPQPVAQAPVPAPIANPAQAPAQLPAQLPKSIQAAQTPAPAAAQPAAPEMPDTPPTITRRTMPVAPRIANKAFLPADLRNSEIRVSVRVFVDAQGRPLKVSIEKGVDGPFGFNDAAKQAAYDSAYSPATRGGKPVNGSMVVDYNFGKPR